MMAMASRQLTDEQWEALAEVAWRVRENAYILGNTKVGSAVMASDGTIYPGCNVEHQFRSHDVHAEVNAVTNMVCNGRKELIAVFVAAERARFTPCGACLDWIFQFGGPDCIVGYQTGRASRLEKKLARELMPYYPN
jgi:cytidine deaminase